MRTMTWALALMACLAWACESERITYYPDTGLTVGSDASTAGDDASTDEPDVAPGAAVIGGSCDVDGDCASGYCLDEAALADIGAEAGRDMSGYTIDGGTCASVGCAADADCDDGATCLDLSAVLGTPLSTCLQPCETADECPSNETWSCFASVCVPTDFFTAGPAPVETQVGGACELDDDCETGTCLNNEFAAGLGLDVTKLPITGGMCSLLFCFADTDCGPGGRCVDGAAFGAEGIALCLQLCVDDLQCRWQEGYGCYRPRTCKQTEPGSEVWCHDTTAVAGTPFVCLPEPIGVASSIDCPEDCPLEDD